MCVCVNSGCARLLRGNLLCPTLYWKKAASLSVSAVLTPMVGTVLGCEGSSVIVAVMRREHQVPRLQLRSVRHLLACRREGDIPSAQCHLHCDSCIVSGLPGLPGVVGDVGFSSFHSGVEHVPCAPVNPPRP